MGKSLLKAQIYIIQGILIMIKEYRLLNKLTQEQLAEKIDISWRHLQRLEQNEENTTVKTLKKIVKVLNIPDDEILKYIHKKT